MKRGLEAALFQDTLFAGDVGDANGWGRMPATDKVLMRPWLEFSPSSALRIRITGGDAPHIGAAALCADGEIRRLDRNGHREGELAAELAERAAARLGCCVCAVCGIHFDGITRTEIASVLAAVREMADAWLGPPIPDGRPSLFSLMGRDALPKGSIPARGVPYIARPAPPFGRRRRARLRDAAHAPPQGKYARSRNRTGNAPDRSRRRFRDR